MVHMAHTAAERAAYSHRVRTYTRSDPRWALRSKAFRNRHGNWCDACHRSGRMDAHHVTYDHAFHGTEPDEDLRSLCRACHDEVHRLARSGMPLRTATDLVIRQRGPVQGARVDVTPMRRKTSVWGPVLALFVPIAAGVAWIYSQLGR